MRIIVVGSGIVGKSVAYECAKAGAKVTVFDSGRIAGGASAVNDGSLLPETASVLVFEMGQKRHKPATDHLTACAFCVRQTPDRPILVPQPDPRYPRNDSGGAPRHGAGGS